MKRIIVIALAVLLVLPVLAVPCLAVTDYRFTYQGISDYGAIYYTPSAVPEGLYILTAYLDVGTVYQVAKSDPFTLPVLDSEFVTLSVNAQLTFPSEPVIDNVFYLTFSQIESGTAMFFNVDAFNPEMYVILSPVSDEPLTGQLLAIAQTAIDWVGQIAAAIVEHPLLLVTAGIFFAGGCIALFSRFLSRD